MNKGERNSGHIVQSNLVPWFAVSVILVLLGMIVMAVEFFKKDT